MWCRLLAAADAPSASGSLWLILVPALVTLVIGLAAYFRPTKDAEARQQSQAALDATAINQMQVNNALAMAKASEEKADHAAERCEACEGRLDEALDRLRTCEDRCAKAMFRLDQIELEREALAEIVDDRVINGAGGEDPPP